MQSKLGCARQTAAERSRAPSRRSPTFIASILAVMAITIMVLAPRASAATPLSMSGETLNSNSGTTSAPGCQLGFISGNTGSFSVAGTATGPYSGTFVENGTFYVSGNNQGPLKSDLYVDFNATFTITVTSPLGMLPITGSLSQAGFDGGVCISGNYKLFNFPVDYTLTGNYSGGGAAGWPASGALVNADFQADTSLATVNESFAAGTAPFTPTVSTGLAVNVASGSATVEGTVDDKGEAATYRFDYGTSAHYGSQTISEPVSDSNSTPTFVDAALTGLSPNTVYHYRIEATDTLGGTSYGADQTLTTTGGTQSLPPAVTTGSASGVGSNSATVGGTVNPDGQATTYHVDYGTSTNYGTQAPGPPDPSAGSGTTAQTESTNLAGLSPNTVYHYRLEATNASGTSYGADQTFTTTKKRRP